jgi:hypothetical protein
MTWKDLLDACDALGISQRRLAGKMQARFPPKERPEGQQGLSPSSLTRYAAAGLVAAPLYVEWFLSLTPTVRGDKQAWAEFVARFSGAAGAPGPEVTPSPGDASQAPEPEAAAPSLPAPAAPASGALPQSTAAVAPSPRRAFRRVPLRFVALGAAVCAIVMLGGYMGWFWQNRAACRRTAEELLQCQNMAAGLARTVERAVELLAARSGGGPEGALDVGGSGEAQVAAKLGGKPLLTTSEKPFSWQKTRPCDPEQDQEAIGDGCWVWTGRTAPCSAKTFENPVTGKCYVPVMKSDPVPQSETPRNEER